MIFAFMTCEQQTTSILSLYNEKMSDVWIKSSTYIIPVVPAHMWLRYWGCQQTLGNNFYLDTWPPLLNCMILAVNLHRSLHQTHDVV